jgi:hypothetical protein
VHRLLGRPAVLIALAIPVGLAASGGAPKLDGAVYGAQIPVYPNAKLRDVGGGTYSDEIGGPVTFESKSWFFAIDDAQKVVAFYQEKLPNVPHEEDEDGGTTFKLTPVGADSGEDVSVTVRKDELQITEVVKPGKRKR